MTPAEFHEALRQLLEKKLGAIDALEYFAGLVDDIATSATQIVAPMLEAHAEACALLAQTLALVNPKEFRTAVDQARLRQAREFLERLPQ